MPTVQEIHTIAPIAIVLASNDVANGTLFGARPNPNLPIQLELIRYAVDYRYNLEGIASGNTPSADLTLTSNYLYSWMGSYGSKAYFLYVSGGVIPNPSGPTIIYGLPITSVYTAIADGEYIINLNLPAGAQVIFVEKSIRVLTTSQYSYTTPNLTLLGGIVMSADEELFYEYVLPIYGGAPNVTTPYIFNFTFNNTFN